MLCMQVEVTGIISNTIIIAFIIINSLYPIVVDKHPPPLLSNVRIYITLPPPLNCIHCITKKRM